MLRRGFSTQRRSSSKIGFLAIPVVFAGTLYAATKNEQLGLLVKKIQYGPEVLEWIEKTENELGDPLKNGQETLNKTFETVHDATQKMQSTIKETQNNAKSGLESVLKTTEHVYKTVKDGIDATVESADQVTKQVQETFENFVGVVNGKPVYPKSTTSIGDAVSQTVARSSEIVEKVAESAPKVVAKAAEKAVASAPKAVESVEKSAEKTVEKVAKAVESVPKSVEKAVENVAEPVPKTTEKTAEKAVEKPKDKPADKPKDKPADKAVKTDKKTEKEPVVTIVSETKSEDGISIAAPVVVLQPQVQVSLEDQDLNSIAVQEQAQEPSLLFVLDEIAKGLESIASSEQTKSKKQLLEVKEKIKNLATFVQVLDADEITQLQSRLQEQSAKFQKTLEDMKQDHYRELADQMSQLGTDYLQQQTQLKVDLLQEYETKLRDSIDKQTQEFQEKLQFDLASQKQEIEKEWKDKIKTQLDEERQGRLARLDHLQLLLKYLEKITLDASGAHDRMYKLNLLSLSVESIERQIKQKHVGDFSSELQVLRRCAQDDEFVRTIVNSLPFDLVQQFVSQQELVNEFTHLQPLLRRFQLLPDQAGPISYLVSQFLSFLMVPRHGLVAGSDVESIVARAEYYLSQNDVDQACREINQLKGWSGRLAQDWLKRTRTHLELEQALSVLKTHIHLKQLGRLL
ncbi:mitochondrial inner membrane protein Mitofilin [Gorgonomyces haynaldii]|nr:mitochondrial inner membrane protein Mitofilin [Gorgonomyces haynaldii]